MHICVKKSGIGTICIFMNVEEKKLKKKIAEKVIVCLKGLKGAPWNTLKLFFLLNIFKIFSSTFIKNAFYTNSKKNHKNMHVIKKKEIIDRKVFKL